MVDFELACKAFTAGLQAAPFTCELIQTLLTFASW